MGTTPLITFYAFSQRGTGKARNEDAMLLDAHIHQGRVREHGEIDTSRPRYFAVADGVAVSTSPHLASRLLLESLQARLCTAQASTPLPTLLHQVRHDYVAHSGTLLGMAATLVGVRIVGSKVGIFNVGDSRAYLLHSDENGPHIRLLSRDHSVLNDMMDDGDITPEQSADAASFMYGLTSLFVADPDHDEFKVHVVSHEWLPGERLLLCSDGLNEVLSDTQIAMLLAGHSEDDLLNACKASRRAGGSDDFSVIVLTFRNT